MCGRRCSWVGKCGGKNIWNVSSYYVHSPGKIGRKSLAEDKEEWAI